MKRSVTKHSRRVSRELPVWLQRFCNGSSASGGSEWSLHMVLHIYPPITGCNPMWCAFWMNGGTAFGRAVVPSRFGGSGGLSFLSSVWLIYVPTGGDRLGVVWCEPKNPPPPLRDNSTGNSECCFWSVLEFRNGLMYNSMASINRNWRWDCGTLKWAPRWKVYLFGSLLDKVKQLLQVDGYQF